MLGAMLLIRKVPSTPVCVRTEKPETGLDNSIETDGTGAPVASLTVPLSVPAPKD